jgi:hypothetical protein
MGLGGIAGIGGFGSGLACGLQMGQQMSMNRQRMQGIQQQRQENAGIWRGLQGLGNMPGGFNAGQQGQGQGQGVPSMGGMSPALPQAGGGPTLNMAPQSNGSYSPPQAGGGAAPVQPMQPPQVPEASSAMAVPGLDRVQDEIWQLESGRRIAGVPDSRAGAVGPMQIMPRTAGGYGVGGAALRDPQTNLGLGRRIVGDLNKRYGGDLEATAVAYNAGPKRADQYIASGRDPSVLPRETQSYLASSTLISA